MVNIWHYSLDSILIVHKCENLNSYISIIPIAFFVLLFSYKMITYTYPYGENKKADFYKISDYLIKENVTNGYSFVPYWRALDVVSEGKCHDTRVIYSSDNHKISVKKDRIYLQEINKPEKIDYYFIIADESEINKCGDLISDYISIKKINDIYILIFNIESWDDKFIIEK